MESKGAATILYSDDAQNWTIIDEFKMEILNNNDYPFPGRVKLSAAPSDADCIYGVIASGFVDGFLYMYGNHIVKSENKGESWQKVSQPQMLASNSPHWATLAWYALTIAVHPQDKDLVVIGGLDLFRTKNGGDSWQQLSSWWNFGTYYDPQSPPYNHADQHAIVFRPETNEMINSLVGSQSGCLFKVTNAQSGQTNVADIGSENFPEANISCIAVGQSEDFLMVTSVLLR